MVEKNPAIQAFVQELDQSRVWGQVLVEREGEQFRLRHGADREVPVEVLRDTPIAALRKLAMYNAGGQFRPLRAAPDLQRGWTCACRSPEELGRALQELYPASIVDWFATRDSGTVTTNYREFTNRQTGMYRITQLLTDLQAAQVIRACCGPGFCLKRRLWTVEGLEPDGPVTKSAIPCLEPCAILLELARKAARIEQEEKVAVQLAPSDFETLILAAQRLTDGKGDNERVGNVGSAVNPRRIQLVLEKYAQAVDGEKNGEGE